MEPPAASLPHANQTLFDFVTKQHNQTMPVMGRQEGVMPKEYVYGSLLPFDDEADPAVVAVGWDKEAGHCQIVTRLANSECPSPEESNPIPAKYGFYVDLDRRGINDLIRHLRKARDQAFGRDE